MNPGSRPPPNVLLIHNGHHFDGHVTHLQAAGLRVSETHADTAVPQVTMQQPDLIVLDFGCDGEITAQLKADPATKHIPVIALVELLRH